MIAFSNNQKQSPEVLTLMNVGLKTIVLRPVKY